MVSQDETVKKAWGNVQSAYQRRADLIPNLVATVKGAAEFEKETYTQVALARAGRAFRRRAAVIARTQVLVSYQAVAFHASHGFNAASADSTLHDSGRVLVDGADSKAESAADEVTGGR